MFSLPSDKISSWVVMKVSKECPTLTSRLIVEYEVLQRILERRVTAKNPNLGKSIEQRIIRRNLDELEAAAHLSQFPADRRTS